MSNREINKKEIKFVKIEKKKKMLKEQRKIHYSGEEKHFEHKKKMKRNQYHLRLSFHLKFFFFFLMFIRFK